MRIISGISEFQLHKPSAIAIGKFDGVHLGHRSLIEKIKKAADKSFLKSVVFTFNPSPESFFCGQALPELTTIGEKRRIFELMGIDVLIEFPLNRETASTEPELFVQKYIREQMRAAYIVAGRDISFGKNGLGGEKLLRTMADECGYECELVDKIKYEGQDISSTRIKAALKDADMELVSALLGRPYTISGIVAHGRRLGRQLGMPTANVIIPPDKLSGPNGVYLSRVKTEKGEYNAVTNVGVKPTVAEDELLCAESYMYDFDGDIYGKYIEVELLKFCRPEMRFASVEELKAQMQKDIEFGRENICQ